jgi:adenosine deaminase
VQSEANARRPPVAERHLHLEGGLTARRALALAERDGREDIPAGLVRDDDRPRWEFDSLRGFLELFGWSTRLLRDHASYVAVLEDLLRSLDEQDIHEAEVFVAIGQMQRLGTDPYVVVPELARAARDHGDRGGCRVWFIADATRQWGVAAAERVLDTALELREHRIVGFGMGGDETALRARDFRGIYRRARAEGLGVTCHAGEGTTPAAVLEVVEELEVPRVGHGIAAAQDPDLMRQLAAAGIVLEICPTSNRRTGAWDVHTKHPIFALLEAGVPCILGSDDPAFFGCTLRSELFAIEQDGLSPEAVAEMCERSLTCGFV